MNNYQVILGIETSCDETGAAVSSRDEDRITILSNSVASSSTLQAKYGGIIPEQAAREQLKAVIPVIREALLRANKSPEQIEAIAVTYGPGLIGPLLIGVETAKVLSITWNKPLIPVNHHIGHFYANWINNPNPPEFPLIGLLVSGGHSDLILFKNHGDYEYLGGTRDDAAGECFDKCARLLGYPYPGGPVISKFAEMGDPFKYKMPIPMLSSGDLDFSFSGLKTSFITLVEKMFETSKLDPRNAEARWKRITSQSLENQDQVIADLCASLQYSIIKSLVNKTLKAMQNSDINELMVAGGVAANSKLKFTLETELKRKLPAFKLHFPKTEYCMDNAAMIASASFFLDPVPDPVSIQADPNLSLQVESIA